MIIHLFVPSFHLLEQSDEPEQFGQIDLSSNLQPVLTDPVGQARTRGEVVAWFYDPRWSGYRTEPALLRFPEKEREAWRNLWADIRDAIE